MTFPVSVGVLEILVAGVTASTWFGMFVAALAGWSHPPNWLGGGATLLLVYATLAYGLGVVVDAAADSLFTRMLSWVWPQPTREPKPIARVTKFILEPRTHNGDKDEPLSGRVFQRLREAALLREDGLAKFMEYQRSRQRIARALTLNLLLLLPIGIWFFTSTQRVSTGVLVGFSVATLTGIVVSGRAAERLRVAYEGHLQQLPIIASAEPFSSVRAAAVCVRAAATGKECFLLVQTKESASSPERWTFPKGHVEPGESLVDAAMREAREEAGAMGVVHSDPLPPYLFPEDASGDGLIVIPFLLEKVEQADPTEPGRMMSWSSPADAKALLRLNREEPFTNEHDRVIDRALELIRRR